MNASPAFYATIDAATSRDIDDAIAVERVGDTFRVWVAIAAPALSVPIGSADDQLAFAAAATRYGGSRVLKPMLPPAISEGSSTLTAGDRRAAMELCIKIDAQLRPNLVFVRRSTITVERRLTYEEIPKVAKQTGQVPRSLAAAGDLASALLTQRSNAGALAFYDARQLLWLDEDGAARRADSVDDMIGHVVVQEIMILSNTLLARWALERDLPFLYRNHQPRLAAPPASELARQLSTAAQIGEAALDQIRARLEVLMAPALYGPQANGHYALALPQYAHCTSPLRRYPDLVNQRQILAACAGTAPPYTQEDLEAIASQVNDTFARVKLERAEAMKDAVRARAARAIDRGQLDRLDTPQLVQAIKISARAGSMPDELASCVRELLNAGSVEDKVLDAIVEASTFGAALHGHISQAFARHLAERPERSKGRLMFAVQTGLASDQSCEEAQVPGGFEAVARIRRACDGALLARSARAARKRDAENLAFARALCAFFGAADLVRDVVAAPPAATPIAAAPQSGQAAAANWKGRLLELCQKRRWPMPQFDVTQTGPANAPIFHCEIRLEVPGGPQQACASGASTKKAAEAAAAAELLQRVSG